MRFQSLVWGRAGLLLLAVAGCSGDSAVEELAQQCGLTCPTGDQGLVAGNASISGVASVDSFFTAVLAVRDASVDVTGTVDTEMRDLAIELGLAVEGKTTAQLAADIKAAVQAEVSANVNGNARLVYQPVRCEADVELSVRAKAECEAQVMPPKVEVDCRGTCDISASATAQCMASGQLSCQGRPPSLVCSGSCQGSCQLAATAACTGICNGECTGTCTVCAGGTCNAVGGVVTNCAGSCSGTCKGECRLEAGGTCSGQCEGTCTYTPPSATCDAGFQARCTAKVEASIKCEGKCEGEVVPGSAKVECNASVKARTQASIVCTPPRVQVEYQFKAGITAMAQATFRAKMNTLARHHARMLAATKKSNAVAKASVELSGQASGAVKEAFQSFTEPGATIKTQFGLTCAAAELPKVGTMLAKVNAELQVSFDAVGAVGEAVGVAKDALGTL